MRAEQIARPDWPDLCQRLLSDPCARATFRAVKQAGARERAPHGGYVVVTLEPHRRLFGSWPVTPEGAGEAMAFADAIWERERIGATVQELEW